jgi:hypothetical protein
MDKYRVGIILSGTVQTDVRILVEADSEEAAQERAEQLIRDISVHLSKGNIRLQLLTNRDVFQHEMAAANKE